MVDLMTYEAIIGLVLDKYLGILISGSQYFKSHVLCRVEKLREKLGFHFRNKLCLSLHVKKEVCHCNLFFTLLEYNDLLYMHTSVSPA